LADFDDQKETKTFVDRLLKSKYSDIIILSTVILAFLILIIISATLT